MSAELAPAWVLGTRRYRESSLLVELFCDQHGRLAALARGARRGKGPTAQLLQPFRPLLLNTFGRGELRTLGRVEEAAPGFRPGGDALACGLYLNELLVRLLPREDPHPVLFARYGETLARLAEGWPLAAPLRRFERDLLEALGVAPAWGREADSGRRVEAAGRYRLLAHGPQRANDAGAVGGAALLALAGGDPECASQGGAIKRVLRHYLDLQLGERPLHSRALLRAAPPGAGARR